jgi:DNA-binding NarL/FixJ family response regulator
MSCSGPACGEPGGSPLQPVVASKLLQRMAKAEPPPAMALTGREAQVLRPLAKGRANQ